MLPLFLTYVTSLNALADRRPEAISLSRSTPKGLSLLMVRELAQSLGMNMQMAKREPDAELVFPAVVHWKSEHYAALLERQGERYLIEDLTFDDRMWVSRAGARRRVERLLSGAGRGAAARVASVDTVEVASVWGRGNTNGHNPENIKSCDRKSGGCSTGSCTNVGVAGYSFHAMTINLNITDTPVGYAPPRGPRVDFLVTYNQRESFQPSVFSYSNLGPKWTFDWLGYVTDDPGDSEATSTVYARGGGQETYTKSGGNYEIHFETYAELIQVSHAPPVYERRMADGSVEVFSQPDGAQASPRKVFMTAWRDTQGRKGAKSAKTPKRCQCLVLDSSDEANFEPPPRCHG